MSYIQTYIKRIENAGKKELAEGISKTVSDIVPKYISNFSFMEHVVSLLLGDVQSGKTSHMFGLMCAAADEGFLNFILLTTDNILLQQQTLKRAQKDLPGFCVCDENDYQKFVENNLRKPAVIVLKKNPSILKKWKNNLATTQFCVGNPLFIIDDEADAASLNREVNKKKQSSINRLLENIKKTTTSSIYMEVTGTPQALLLQSHKSGWKPYFIYYFKPGEKYLGGNFFFAPEKPKQVILTDDEEAQELIEDDEFPENGLKDALVTHLVTSAQIMLAGGETSNFLIHPSVKVEQHTKFAEKIGNYLNEIAQAYEEEETQDTFQNVYSLLKSTKKDMLPFERIQKYIRTLIKDEEISILVLNSEMPFEENTQYEKGVNIIVGGNSIGRGVTFPMLQTVYYCRVAKTPQADTMWQHARMFGYDRDPELVRLFIPPKLFKLFSDINKTNNGIIAQIIRGNKSEDIRIVYPKGLKPTRKTVLDNDIVKIFSGGVNYFPFLPVNKDIALLDKLLSPFDDATYTVNLKLIKKIIEQLGSENGDWDPMVFIGFIDAIIATNPIAQGKLIVRRKRDIGKGTGTLLSPSDRKLGDTVTNEVLLTMYKITGNLNKGWNGEELWIPNIKLPAGSIYYAGDIDSHNKTTLSMVAETKVEYNPCK